MICIKRRLSSVIAPRRRAQPNFDVAYMPQPLKSRQSTALIGHTEQRLLIETQSIKTVDNSDTVEIATGVQALSRKVPI